ncbi:MAG: TonB family protein, partial [Saprospiraceae bacterium]
NGSSRTSTMNELVSMLTVASLACSAAIALVLMLRKPMRRRWGAHVAYAMWGLVLWASLATLLPAPPRIVVRQLAPALSGSSQSISGPSIPSSPLPAMTSSSGSFDSTSWLIEVWAVGVAVSVALFLLQRRRFMRSLGTLREIDEDLLRAETVVGSPALVGLWRPRIVLPADFEQRYSRLERDLILAHEHHHRAHGDTHINTLAAFLRSVFWFNPLVHVAAMYFVIDQEVACDAAVVARFPHARRSYAEAMLKTQLGESHAFLACHWHARNPLLERIAMLKTPSISMSRRWLGVGIAAIAIVSGSYAAWAAQPTRTEVHYVDAPTTIATAASDNHAPHSVHNPQDRIVTTDQWVTPNTEKRSNATKTGEARQSSSFGLQQRKPSRRADGKPATSPSPPIAADRNAPQARMVALRVRDGSQSSAPDAIASAQVAANRQESMQPEPDRSPQEIASYRRTHPPKYPDAAVRGHIEGKVVLNVHVDASGKPIGADVASVTPPTATELASASATAVLQWRFSPAVHAGVPVFGDVSVPFSYALDGDRSYASAEPTRQASLRTVRAIDYPSEQARSGVEGVVYVKVHVEKNGAVSSMNVDHVDPSSATPLAAAALAGVNTWTFNPARKNGWDAPSVAIVPVVFSLRLDSPVRVAPALDRLDPIRVVPNS